MGFTLSAWLATYDDRLIVSWWKLLTGFSHVAFMLLTFHSYVTHKFPASNCYLGGELYRTQNTYVCEGGHTYVNLSTCTHVYKYSTYNYVHPYTVRTQYKQPDVMYVIRITDIANTNVNMNFQL